MTSSSTPSAPIPEYDTGAAFSQALAAVEHHRALVRLALGLCLVTRLLGEFKVVTLVRNSPNLIAVVPTIGVALLSYLIVLWFLATRTRDRFGFAMALGIGVLQATYLVVMAIVQRPFVIATEWPSLTVVAAHALLVIAGFRAAAAYPSHDSKQPWIVGFVTALVFVALPWVAPSVIDIARRVLG